MATLITPDREQITPVSAPSMIGIDPDRVPCSRLTMLNAVVCPASAQHSSATTSRNEVTAMHARRSHLLIGTNARAAPIAIDIPPHTSQVTRAAMLRFGTVTLANGWEKANVESPAWEKYPSTKMSMSPKNTNVAGASQRRKALPGTATVDSTVGTRSEIVMRSPPWTARRGRRPPLAIGTPPG